jgi:hypothetical protein
MRTFKQILEGNCTWPQDGVLRSSGYAVFGYESVSPEVLLPRLSNEQLRLNDAVTSVLQEQKWKRAVTNEEH